MAWFDVYKSEISVSTGLTVFSSKQIPLKRVINISEINNNVAAGEQIYVDLLDKKINKFINSLLENVTDNYSYLVVLEDHADETFFLPVKSRVIDNILYFYAEEDIDIDIDTTRYYAIYYGLTNIKNIELTLASIDATPKNVWVIADIAPSVEGSYADIATANINYYTSSITSSSSGKYSLALYNDGADWKDNTSEKIASKAFGIFDGPRLKVVGPKGKQYGKFKIRIFEYTDQGVISVYPTVDWTEVDCYSAIDLSDQILYSKIDLQYKKYIFELETLAEKNIMAITNSVKIDKYEFSPNYGLTYSQEEINPNLAFITIAGLR